MFRRPICIPFSGGSAVIERPAVGAVRVAVSGSPGLAVHAVSYGCGCPVTVNYEGPAINLLSRSSGGGREEGWLLASEVLLNHRADILFRECACHASFLRGICMPPICYSCILRAASHGARRSPWRAPGCRARGGTLGLAPTASACATVVRPPPALLLLSARLS